MPSISQSVLEIDLGAMGRNWQKFKNLGAPITTAVIKADAYGLGAQEAARVFQDLGCKDFFVAHFEEATAARKFISANCRIFVLNGCYQNQCELMAEFDLTPIINSIEQFYLWQAENPNLPYGLHIDTGMSRLGLRFDDFQDFETINKINPPSLIMSHLACASDVLSPKNQEQLELFDKASQYFESSQKSLSASAGALLGKQYLKDLIRPGIGLYGGNPLDNIENLFEAVAILKSPIIQKRIVKKGVTIGYGATYIAQKDMNMGIVALGYADGFLRSASNKGTAFINGKECPILGRVSMDLIAIDLENANIKIGDYAEFLGKNSLIDMQANHSNTISYEYLTRLGNRFARKYINP